MNCGILQGPILSKSIMSFTSKYQHIGALILFFSLFIGLYRPLLAVKGFSPKDDFVEMVLVSSTSLLPQIQTWAEPYSSLGHILNHDIEANGRFRPAYWILNYAEAHLLVPHARLWQFETLLIGTITVWLFYLACRRLTCSFLPAIWGGLWFMLSGCRLWKEKQTAEEPGLLILLIALNMIIYTGHSAKPSRWDWAALVLLVLAGLMKESFVMIIPAVVGLRLILRWYALNFTDATEDTNRSIWQVLNSFRWYIAVGIAVTALMVFPIFYVYHLNGYGHRIAGDINTNRLADINAWWALVQEARGKLLDFGPLLTLVVGIRYLRTPKHRLLFVLGMALCIMWVGPQMFLYLRSGFVGYYIFPAALALIFLSSLGLEWIHRSMPHVVFLAVYGLCIAPLMYYTLTASWMEIQTFAGTTEAFQGVVDATTTHVDDNHAILVVLPDAWWGREISLLVELGRAHIQSPVYMTYEGAIGSLIEGQGIDKIYKPFSLADVDQIDMIISYQAADQFRAYAAQNFVWFDEDDWTGQTITGDFRLLSWKNTFGVGSINTLRSIKYSIFYR